MDFAPFLVARRSSLISRLQLFGSGAFGSMLVRRAVEHGRGQTEGQLDGWSVGRLDARRSARAGERKGGWLVGRALGHKEAGSGGQTDRRMDKQVGIMCTGNRTSLKKKAATDL